MATTSSSTAPQINCARFYFEWKGHPIEDLTKFRDTTLATRPDKPIIYLAGDSSLDNKFWVSSRGHGEAAIPAIYHDTLSHPSPKPDVAFWMNHLLGNRATCINTAVEASMLRERDKGLLYHDEFIRDSIRAQDMLIVSIGANDIALKPNFPTIWHMLWLAWLTPRSSLTNQTASSLQYFEHLFGTKIDEYIRRLTSVTKPSAVVVCMIYFPLEEGLGQASWADHQLRALGYKSYPGQLQTVIRAMYDMATRGIRVEGTEIIPCALYEILDGRSAGDYTDRVEPNENGGKKMALRFVELLDYLLDPAGG